MTFEVGQFVGIDQGTWLNGQRSAITVAMVHAEVVDVSPKAVMLRGDTGKACWFPKKALVAVESAIAPKETAYHRLAKWFKPNDYACRWLEYNVSVR